MITYLSAVLRRYLNFTNEEVDQTPYPKVLCYLHSVMVMNGNNTEWAHEDSEQTAQDKAFINSLNL